VAIEKFDAKTGIRWRKVNKYYETGWFGWLLLLACFGIGCGLWSLTDHPFLLTSNPDSARYLELAQGLVQGRGYGLHHAAGPAVPDTMTPPLYPAVIAVMMLILKPHHLLEIVHPLKYLNLGLYLFSTLMFYQVSRRLIRVPYPLVMTVLFTLSPLMLLALGDISPIMLFVTLSLSALFLADCCFEDKHAEVTPLRLWGSVVLTGLAMAAHPAGILLAIALSGLALRWLGWKRGWLVPASFIALSAAWIFRGLYHQANSPALFSEISDTLRHTVAFSAPNLDRLADFDFWKRSGGQWVPALVRGLLGTAAPEALTGQNNLLSSLWQLDFRMSALQWIHWLFIGLLGLGALAGLFRKSGVLALFLILYAATALAYGWWDPVANFAPIFPGLLFLLFFGLYSLAEWLKFLKLPILDIMVPALTLLMLFNSAGSYLDYLREARLTKAYYQSGKAQLGVRTGYLDAFRWIGANTPKSSALIAPRPTLTYVYTGRKTLPIPQGGTLDDRLATLLKADYVMEETGLRAVRNQLSPLLGAQPKRFRLVYNDPAAQVRIWQVIGTPVRNLARGLE
jgi:hypothetical protein